MTPLQWNDIPEKIPTSPQRKNPSYGLVVRQSNPWFVTAMGLIGFIAGYVVHMFLF